MSTLTSIQLLSPSALAGLPPAEPLENTKFIARGFNVVFGPSGAYKSFYVLGECLQIAQTQPVVYVAAEGSSGLFKRVAAWCKHTGQEPGNIHFICQEISLLDIAHTRQLITAITPLKPAFIVFDTLARCIPGGDENTARDMGLAVRHSALIQRELDCAVAWIHHSNRADKGERGSGATRGAADAMMELTSPGDGIIKLTCSKMKDDEPWPTEELQFHKIDDSGVLIPATGILTSSLSDQEKRIIEFLALDVFETSGANARSMVAALNIGERYLYQILSRLKRAGYIDQDKKGDPYYLTVEGAHLFHNLRRRAQLTVVPTTLAATEQELQKASSVDEPVVSTTLVKPTI